MYCVFWYDQLHLLMIRCYLNRKNLPTTPAWKDKGRIGSFRSHSKSKTILISS